MKTKKYSYFTVSVYYLTALIYGDLSGVSESEIENVESFIEDIGTGTIEVVEGSEDFRTCEVCGLKSDTVDILVHYFEGA